MKPSASIVFERGVSGSKRGALEDFVVRASRVAGLRAQPGVLITGDRQMRRLNHCFRNKNSATDVLSFPAGELADGLAGDIAVSFDIAARNARALGHSVSDELRILILHGILHLAGYDHERDRGEMSRKETVLRRRFELPTSLIERNSKTSSDGNSPSVVRRRPRAKARGSASAKQRPATNRRRPERT